MTEAGKLNLVRNDSLRELISNWSELIHDLNESEEDYSALNRNDFRPFLYEYGNYRSIINYRIKNSVITSTLVNQQYENKAEIGESSLKSKSSTLLRSNIFEN